MTKINKCSLPFIKIFSKGYDKLRAFGTDGRGVNVVVIDACIGINSAVSFFNKRLTFPNISSLKNSPCPFDNMPVESSAYELFDFLTHGYLVSSISSSAINTKSVKASVLSAECKSKDECVTIARHAKDDPNYKAYLYTIIPNQNLVYMRGKGTSILTVCGVAPLSLVKFVPASINFVNLHFAPSLPTMNSVVAKSVDIANELSSNNRATQLFVFSHGTSLEGEELRGERKNINKVAKEICSRWDKEGVSQIMFVAAAGNDGIKLDKGYKGAPASLGESKYVKGCKPFYAVGSVSSDEPSKKYSDSNYGPEVDIYTYGSKHVGANPSSSAIKVDGTSFATPMIAGIIARILKCKPAMHPMVISKVLSDMSDLGITDPITSKPVLTSIDPFIMTCICQNKSNDPTRICPDYDSLDPRLSGSNVDQPSDDL